MTDSPVSEELLALEHAGWRSLCDGTGDRFYGDVMTDDALMVLANGAVMDRATVVSALGQSPPWARYAIDDVQMITIAEDTAALVYTGTGWRDGNDAPFIGAMSSVYRRTGDGWKLALYQQTARQ
ncbi:nuclear transport factor 2 family protein [Mycolicibacterium chlorophenolicum]|jgi:pyruvate/2-oxoacid:ferredoxin oxidoreductase beta subunit|uniref:nuclear transport factor 2 family protein n=1 Tax=Mycolicibacterium chlorophenolicum TaxID=37916 RepID=UPI0006545254|nr:nuclear transport factor 2 family protein [Mycolicibacterium chlorophenolicum]